jgi:ADP-ribose pyrophosphatase
MHYPHCSVGVVAVNEKGEILLVRAYRYINESFDWEIPGGLCEIDEHHVDATRRELMEETGYSCELLTLLLKFFPHKATCTQEYYIYLAEGLKRETEAYQTEEISEIGWRKPEQVLKMIETGEINDSMSIVALQQYMLLRKK